MWPITVVILFFLKKEFPSLDFQFPKYFPLPPASLWSYWLFFLSHESVSPYHSNLLMLEYWMSVLFFMYVDPWLLTLILSHVFKCQLQAEGFYICISRPNFTLEFQSHIYNYLSALTTSMCSGHVPLNMSKTKLLVFCPISILLAAFPILVNNIFQGA